MSSESGVGTQEIKKTLTDLAAQHAGIPFRTAGRIRDTYNRLGASKTPQGPFNLGTPDRPHPTAGRSAYIPPPH